MKKIKKCSWCGADFVKGEPYTENGVNLKHRFCSLECREKAWRHNSKITELHPEGARQLMLQILTVAGIDYRKLVRQGRRGEGENSIVMLEKFFRSDYCKDLLRATGHNNNNEADMEHALEVMRYEEKQRR